MRPEVIFIQGPQGTAPLTQDEVSTIRNGNFIITGLDNKIYAVPYDFTLSRVVSALFNSLAVLFVVVLAGFLIENIWLSVAAGVFLTFTPRFVFLGQLVTFESISVGLFCLTIWYFPKLLKNNKKLKPYVVVGLLSGLLFWTRYNNIIVFPFLAGWMGIDYILNKKKEIFSWRLLIIPIVAFLVGFLTWPYLWHNFPQSLMESFGFHKGRFVGLSTYYWEYLLFTTPIPFLATSVLGIFQALRKRGYWQIIILWWVLCTVVVYSIFVFKLGGTRYVSIIYPPMAILSVYGIIQTFKKRALYVIAPVLLFMFIEMVRVFPYYLDYYNQLIGGASGAIERGYDFSWWGEGQREAGLWMNDNLPASSSAGLIVTPKYVFPNLNQGIKMTGFVDEKSDAQYLAVSWSNYKVLSKDFINKHEIIYQAMVDGQTLVYVLRKK